MNESKRNSLFILRVVLGWMFFYAGITKVLDSNWSAAGYLKGAKVLTGFYGWLASPSMLPVVNFFNEWGLTLLGVSLLLGIFIRYSALLGIALMVLYYLPILNGFYPNPHSFLVDEHIIYAGALLVLWAFEAGNIWGLEKKFSRKRN